MAGALPIELPVVVPAVMRVPRRRPFHVADGNELGRLVLDVEVAERGLADRGLDARDHVARVDRRVDAVLAEHRDRDDVHLLRLHDVAVAPFLELLPAPERDGIRAGQARRLDEARRIEPEVELIELGELGRNGDGLAIAVDVPSLAAVDDVRLPRLRLRRCAVLPAETVLPRRGTQARFAVEGLDARAGSPVDRAGVIGERIDARPIDVDGVLEGLADGAGVARPRERDAVEVGFADLARGGREQRGRVDVPGRERLGE